MTWGNCQIDMTIDFEWSQFYSIIKFHLHTVCLKWKYFFPRLHGSYEALKYGTSLDGLSDLTGGIAESILLKPSYTSLLTTLNNLLKMTSIVLCKWDKDNQSDANQSVSAYFEKKNKKTKKIAAFFFSGWNLDQSCS